MFINAIENIIKIFILIFFFVVVVTMDEDASTSDFSSVDISLHTNSIFFL